MAHFGVLCYKGAGHLNPMLALSRKLVERGDRVTVIHTADLQDRVLAQGLEFRSLGTMSARRRGPWGAGHSWKFVRDLAVLRQGIDNIGHDMEFFLQRAPSVLEGAGIDCLLIDEITLAGPTVAEICKLPYIVVSTSVPHNFGWNVSSIGERASWFERVQRRVLQVSVLCMRGPVRWSLNRLRRSRGLKSTGHTGGASLEFAHITQLPQCLDFPRQPLPHNFHYAGPFVDEEARIATYFPWHMLDDRPMVYASLGTSRTDEVMFFNMVAEACAALHVQLVISLGGRRDPESLGALPENPIVRREVPQLELIRRAHIVVSHGGLNTALESLMEGKPLVVIPKSLDQPVVAARLAWHGVAEVISPGEISVQVIQAALTRIFNEPCYRHAAIGMQEALRSAQGLEYAADVIQTLVPRQRSPRHGDTHVMTR
jgi:zeaxanthin glucosyltransferase